MSWSATSSSARCRSRSRRSTRRSVRPGRSRRRPPAGARHGRRRRAKEGALRRAPGRVTRRGRAPGGAGRGVAGHRGGLGGGGAADPHRDAGTGWFAAGTAAGRRYRPPRPAHRLRGRPPGRLRRLPGQDHRHRARPGPSAPRLLPLRRLRARRGAQGRRAGRGRLVAVAWAGHDGGPRGRRRPVRQGQQPAGRPGRDRADHQAGRTRRRGRRCGRRGGHPGPRRRDPVPPGRPPPAGALPDKLYIAVDGTGVPMVPAETAGRAGKAADGRAHTREIDQTRLPVHPFQPGPRRPTRARPRLLHLPGHPRPRRTVRPAGARRGPPPRIRTHPPTRRTRRRRTLDLEPGRPTPSRRHPDRRPLPAREHLHDLAKDSPPSSARTTRPG